MTFNLKDIMAKLVSLESRAEAAFKAELTELKNLVTGQLTTLQTEAATAATTIASLGKDITGLNAQVSELTGKLSESNKAHLDATTSLRTHLAALPGHEDYKDGGKKAGATLMELIAAEQNATNTAIAATGVKTAQLPAGGKAPEVGDGKIVNLTEACMKANKKGN